MKGNSYPNQKLRGLKRKLKAIEILGNSCQKCGYNKNISALEFHHLNPEIKDFNLDMRRFSNLNIEILKKEIDKCILLCSNCHRELHNPTLELNNIDLKDNLKKDLDYKKGTECPICHTRFLNITGKKFCSTKCRFSHFPTLIELNEKYNKLKSWEKVSQFFNITRGMSQRIRKKKF